MIAEQVVQRATMSGRKLAKEVLDDFMTIFVSISAVNQPKYNSERELISGDPNEFERWAVLARDTAASLARYQSPTFKAIVVPAPGSPVVPSAPGGNARNMGNVIDVSNEAAVARIYREVMLAPAPPRKLS